MTPEYLKFKAKLKRKEKVLAKHEFELAELKKECPHEEIERKESYFDGSYYDRASTTAWNQCMLCGKRSETTTFTHSWYG